MAIQLVERLFPGELAQGSSEQLDIKPDVHTRRVLYRLGFATSNSDNAAITAARRLLPEHPGRIDAALWYAGQTWCHPRNPNCTACALAHVCAKRIETEEVDQVSTRERPEPRARSGPTQRGRPSGTYRPLQQYLQQHYSTRHRLTLTFSDIEKIIGRRLPSSAYNYRPWWANAKTDSTSPQNAAWSGAGYRVASVSLREQSVEFVRGD